MIEFELTKMKTSCYGCRACEQICPKNAIMMKKDEEGFLYPEINKQKCIDCGLCSNVCPYSKDLNTTKIEGVYAVQYKNENSLMESSSGGAFSLFADYVLATGGYVSGCIFDDNFNAIHVISNDGKIVEKMRGSKYLQSDTKDIYQQIEKILKLNKEVLFTGTPCQVDGLKKYLGKEYENLFTLDLICHGVPSLKIFKEYLKAEQQGNNKVEKIKFRDKRLNGWCAQGSIKLGKKIKNISCDNSSYYQYYLKNYISRYCCYSCKYASIKRVGDITIGDYWNIGELLPNLNVTKGYSIILISSLKGKKLFEMVKKKCIYYETDLEFAVKNNINLVKPSKLPKVRETIYKDIQTFGYGEVAKKECRYRYFFPVLRKYLPKKLKMILKKLKRG